jgi:hypothetical protein
MMNIEQVIELVEKWSADSSSVTVEELKDANWAAAAYWADAHKVIYTADVDSSAAR